MSESTDITITPEVNENISDELPEGADEKDGKFKTAVVKVKKNIKSNGKTAIINFIVRQIITCILSAALGAGIVFFAQNTFEEDFEDYYHGTLVELSRDSQEILPFFEVVISDFENAWVYYEENDIDYKSKELLKKASAYHSNNEEINRLHALFVDYCEELYETSRLAYYSSKKGENIEDIAVEYLTKAGNLEIKLKIFVEEKNKLCEKHDIEVVDGIVKSKR